MHTAEVLIHEVERDCSRVVLQLFAKAFVSGVNRRRDIRIVRL